MKHYAFRLAAVMWLALTLAACLGPKTPQEVNEAFWEAVITNDVESAVEYSTLKDASGYDAFAKEWSGFQPKWGKVVIEGDKATIVSKFVRSGETESEKRKFTTHLVRWKEEWKVDYARTAEEVSGGPLGGLFEKFSKLGDDLTKQFESSADDFNAEMERISRELEALSESISQQASESVDQFAEELSRSIEALEESINRALEEQEKNLSDQDRRALQEAAGELQEDRESLDEPTIASIADSSRGLGRVQQRLNAMDDEVVGDYKAQWQAWADKVESEMAKMSEEFAASIEGSKR